MLITIFRAAALLGGAVPLRLIGIAACAVTVLAVALAANSLGGRRAATRAAIAAATFLVSPLTGSREVNGELLAAPPCPDPRPQLRVLTTTLTGPRAPTWSVSWSGTAPPGPDTWALTTALRQNYCPVEYLDGQRVYPHRGIRSSAPAHLASPHVTS